MNDLKQNRERLLDAAEELRDTIEISFRAMFGGACAYANGRVFAILTPAILALKFPPEAHQQILAAHGEPLQFGPEKPVMKNYFAVPDSMDLEQLEKWVQRSVAAALVSPPPRQRPRRETSVSRR